MIPLLALAPQGFDLSKQPAWVDALLRDAPPSLVMPTPEPPRSPNGERQLPPGSLRADQIPLAPPTPPSARPDRWRVLQDRASDLLAHGRFEEAYRLEVGCHEDDDQTLDVDRLPDAALLTGRYAEAQRLMVQWARLRGAVGDTALRLSLASAAQGRVYPGQGAWVLAELRDYLAWQSDQAPLAAGYGAPTTPSGVAALSVLTLGLFEREPAYLEWALRLDPRCALAGVDLVDEYGSRHRLADAARMAASTVKAQPPGPARDRLAAQLAARLKEMKARETRESAPAKG